MGVHLTSVSLTGMHLMGRARQWLTKHRHRSTRAGRSSRTSYASMRHLRHADMYKDKNGKPTGGGSVIVRGLGEPRRAYGMISRCEWDSWCSLLRTANRYA